jgi:hypothetical protein
MGAVVSAKPPKVIVFLDAPRNQAEAAVTQDIQLFLEKCSHLVNLELFTRTENLGVDANVLSGLDQVFRTHKSAIVLEDDCIPNQDFFEFCDKVLRAGPVPQIGVVSGTNLAEVSASDGPYWISAHPITWGWGTWAKVWNEFRAFKRPSKIASLVNASHAIPGLFQKALMFNLILKRDVLKAWDIEFYQFLHARRLLTLMPKQNLVLQAGFDEVAVHADFERVIMPAANHNLSPKFNEVEIQTPNRAKGLEREASKIMARRLLEEINKSPVRSLRQIFVSLKRNL